MIVLLIYCTILLQETILLNGLWNLHNPNNTININATVPGFIQTDLLDNNIIKDPFLNDYENHSEWVEYEDWIYTHTFHLSHASLAAKKHILIFSGIDTIATIKFNNQTFDANNMFREWRYDVSESIAQNNTLTVTIKSPLNYSITQMSNYPYRIPV